MIGRLVGWLRARIIFTALILLMPIASPTTAAINTLRLGATLENNNSQLTFRVYSSRATHIDLYLYKQPVGSEEIASFPLTKDPHTEVWSKTLPMATIRDQLGLTGTIYYGYRAWGPNWAFSAAWKKGSAAGFITDVDQDGNRFNPNKLLFDPYAKEISHDPITPAQRNGTIYASGPDHRSVDTGLYAPKGIVLIADATSFGTKPTRPLKDDIIYEVHVRGLTKNDPGISEAFRGTYRGAALKAPYLKEHG